MDCSASILIHGWESRYFCAALFSTDVGTKATEVIEGPFFLVNPEVYKENNHVQNSFMRPSLVMVLPLQCYHYALAWPRNSLQHPSESSIENSVRLLKIAPDRDLDAGRVLWASLAVHPAERLVAVTSEVGVADIPVRNGLWHVNLDGVLGIVYAGDEEELVVDEPDLLAVDGAGEENGLGDVGGRIGNKAHGRVDGEVWEGLLRLNWLLGGWDIHRLEGRSHVRRPLLGSCPLVELRCMVTGRLVRQRFSMAAPEWQAPM